MLPLLVAASVFLAQAGEPSPHSAASRIEIGESLRKVLDRERIPFVEEAYGIDESDVWQTGPYCGVNSLYMFLKMVGVTVRYDDLKKELPVGEKGASCLDLQKCAEKHGVPLDVLSIKPGDIRKLGFPIIALLGTGLKEGVMGHYIVICNETQKEILAVDGTTGNLDRISRPVFNRAFSGYVLARRGLAAVARSPFVLVDWALLVGCVLNFIAIVSLGFSRAPRREAR